MPVYHVKLHDSIYFVVIAEGTRAAKDAARTLLGDGWGTPKLTSRQEPYHSTVGHRFRGWEVGSIYRCTSYDSRQGFWMENEADPKDRRNVSERAIGRTYHRIYEELSVEE